MKKGSPVLACVDQSRFADHVADHAAWASRRLEAPLEFLHVIDRHPEMGSDDDRSGAIGIDAQEALLTQLSEKDAAVAREAREKGRVFLNRLRERVMAAGIEAPDTRQRHGSLRDTLVELEPDVGLFVLGRRGESAAATQRDLGRNVEWVVRALHRPILTVTEDFREPQRVMVAFDGGSVTRRAIATLADSPLLKGLPIHLLMSGRERPDSRRHLERARGRLEARGFTVTSALVPGDPEHVVAKTILDRDIDLLVMGAYAHSPLRSLIFGSKTNDLLRSARIPTLLMR
jgi:nucleotide-binding universal stress UspA family protein